MKIKILSLLGIFGMMASHDVKAGSDNWLDNCVYDNFTKTWMNCDNQLNCKFPHYSWNSNTGSQFPQGYDCKQHCGEVGKGTIAAHEPPYVVYCGRCNTDWHWRTKGGTGCPGSTGHVAAICGGYSASLPPNAIWYADAGGQCWRWICADGYLLNNTSKNCEKVTPGYCLNASASTSSIESIFHKEFRHPNPAMHTFGVVTVNGAPKCTYDCSQTGYAFSDKTYTTCIPCVGNDKFSSLVTSTGDSNEQYSATVCTVCQPTQVVNRARTACVPAQEMSRSKINMCWATESKKQGELNDASVDGCVSGYYVNGNSNPY